MELNKSSHRKKREFHPKLDHISRCNSSGTHLSEKSFMLAISLGDYVANTPVMTRL